MSWQATTWAQGQKTGKAATKLLLMVLANYADEHGQCWPSQKTLADACEVSVDAIQRHSRKLEQLGLVWRQKAHRLGGQWAGWHYTLNMPSALGVRPQIAARSKARRPRPTTADQAATSPVTGPQIERSPGRKYCGMNSNRNIQRNSQATSTSIANDLASKPPTNARAGRSRRDIQDLQRSIVSKLGNGDVQAGWLIFGSLETWRRKQLENLEADDNLTREHVVSLLAGEALRGGGSQKSEAVCSGTGGEPSNAKSWN